MPTGNPTHLLKLADREFKALTEERPTPQPSRKFKPMKLNVARFDQSWDRKRGATARLTAVLLQEDDATLQRRVCESDKRVKDVHNRGRLAGTRVGLSEEDGAAAGRGGRAPVFGAGTMPVRGRRLALVCTFELIGPVRAGHIIGAADRRRLSVTRLRR